MTDKRVEAAASAMYRHDTGRTWDQCTMASKAMYWGEASKALAAADAADDCVRVPRETLHVWRETTTDYKLARFISQLLRDSGKDPGAHFTA